MKRTLYGREHPETSASLNNLAYILESQRRFDEAEAAYQDSLSINRKLLGKNHPSVAVTLLNIAFVDFARGDVRGAIKTARESLEMSRAVLGSEHPDVGARASSLGYMLIEAGEYAEAGKLLDEAIAIRRKSLGERHPNVGTSLALKALLELLNKRPQQAYALAEQAREITTEGLPAGSWQIALALDVEGGALMRMGRYAEAEPLMLASQRDLPRAPLPYLAEKSRLRLIELYHSWGKDDEVRKLRAAM
jgi:tetratricopeptide (TPR) repeat protein